MTYPLIKKTLLVAALSSVSVTTFAKPIYTIENLGTIGDPAASSTAYSLNEVGQVVGSFVNADGYNQAYVWDSANGMQALGTLGGEWSNAVGINNLGDIVGNSATLVTNQESGFVMKHGEMTQIIDLTPSSEADFRSSYAQGINDAGHIVGYYDEYVYNNAPNSISQVSGESFLKTDDGLELSGRVAGNNELDSGVNPIGLNALNQNGDYVGTNIRADGSGVDAIVKKRNEDIQVIGTLDGGAIGYGFDINDYGVVVGRSTLSDRSDGYHSYIYTESTGMVDMNHRFGYQQSNLRNINNSNMALGWGSNNFQSPDEDPIFAPFLFDVGIDQTFFLNDFLTVDSDFVSLDFAYSINELNDVVGYGTTRDGLQRAFLMTYQGQIPEPSTIALLLGATLSLVIRRRRHV